VPYCDFVTAFAAHLAAFCRFWSSFLLRLATVSLASETYTGPMLPIYRRSDFCRLLRAFVAAFTTLSSCSAACRAAALATPHRASLVMRSSRTSISPLSGFMPYIKFLAKKAIDLGVNGVGGLCASIGSTIGGVKGRSTVFNFKRTRLGLSG